MTKRGIASAAITTIVCNIIEYDLIRNLRKNDEHADKVLNSCLNQLRQLANYFEKNESKKA